MKTLVELYTIVLESLEKGEKSCYYNNGICGEVEDLQLNGLISWREYDELLIHLNTVNPSKNPLYKKFTRGKFYTGKAWWWVKMKEDEGGRKVRIKFVKEIIKNLKDEKHRD